MAAGLDVITQCSTVGDGVLNVAKASGWTSHDVVAKLRGLLGVRRIGHAGTLDPAATGVLPVLVGKGTRIAEYLMDWDKEYRAILRLGETTDTQDATGTVLATRSTEGLTAAAIRSAIALFEGPISQVPPMYSAVKVRGVPLYKAARAGRTVERGPREVTVHEIEVLGVSTRDVDLRIVCSKGTYIRTLCADIGESLGVGGHLLTLERTRVGPLTLQRALSVGDVAARSSRGDLGEILMSLDEALAALPAGMVDEPTSARVLHGVPVSLSAIQWEEGRAGILLQAGQTVRLKTRTGRLLALGTMPAPQRSPTPTGAPQSLLPISKVLAEQVDQTKNLARPPRGRHSATERDETGG